MRNAKSVANSTISHRYANCERSSAIKKRKTWRRLVVVNFGIAGLAQAAAVGAQAGLDALVVGNPARQMGWVSEYGHRLEFDENGMATCDESSQEYQLVNNIVKRIK